jgi:2-iminobutanoate/2-iminopropanoate deaminase
MPKKAVESEEAPRAIGPYSQAILSGNFLFLSGQLPIDPVNGEISGDIKAQTDQIFKNMAAILAEVGASLKNVLKTTVFLKDLNDFAAMNEAYKQYFAHEPPARTCVQVAGIPRGALIEIESIVEVTGSK